MKIPVVFLFAMCFALACGNVRYEKKAVETKTTRGSSEFQVTKTSTMKTPSGRALQEDLQAAQQTFSSNPIRRDLIRDDGQQASQHPRRQTTPLQSQDQTAGGSSTQRNDQPSFPQYQQNDQQSFPQYQQNDQQSFPQYQQNDQQSFPQYQQLGSLPTGSAGQPQLSEHAKDFPSQQQGFVEGFQPGNQERYFKDRNEAENQRIVQPFLDSTSQQMKIEDDSRIAKGPIQEYRQGPLYISTVDTRGNPLNTLPRLTQAPPSSILVSGVKNVPLFPAVVYNVKSAPSPHAIVYGKDSWYRGGASVRQHYGGPNPRFDYNHPL